MKINIIALSLNILGMSFIILGMSHSYNFYNVKYIENYDGDTLKVSLPGVHPVFGERLPIRIRGVDTAEIRTSDSCEKVSALQAKKFVEKTLEGSKQIDLRNCGRGKYFRLVCDVYADRVSLSEKLLEQHLAVIYDGGTKDPYNWCQNSE